MKKRYQARLDGKVKKADDGLDWSGLVTIVAPVLEDVYTAGATASADDLNVSPFDQLNTKARDYARTRGAELVGMKYNADGELVENPNAEMAITDSTRNALRDLETKAFEEGLSPVELADQINELIDDPARAELIANTDLAMAQSEGSLEAWKQSGVVTGKVWILSGDHSEPDECDDNADAGVIGIDEDFPSGDDVPGAHPACTCDCAAVIDQEE